MGRRSEPHHGLQELEVRTAQEVEATVRAMGTEWSAVLTIEAGGRSLLVGASDGVYTVTALLGAEGCFDLLGDAAARDTIRTVQGGQGVDLPRRHGVSPDQACDVATRFFVAGTVAVTGAAWERQAGATKSHHEP